MKNKKSVDLWDKSWENSSPLNSFGMLNIETVAKKISKFVPKGSTVLDIGVGAGDNSLALNRRGYKVLGIDNSEKALKIAARRGLKVKKENAFALGFKDNAFDLTMSHGLLEHFESEKDKITLLKEHIRCSRKWIVITLPARNIIANFHEKYYFTPPVKEYRISLGDFLKIIKSNFRNIKILKARHYFLFLNYIVIIEKLRKK